MLLRQTRLIAVLVFWFAAGQLAVAESPLSKVSFSRDVRPILARHCFACHGPDETKRKAKLRLDVREDAFAKHDDVFAFVPRSLENSNVYERVTSEDPQERMPPGGADKRLKPEEIATLKAWIESGADWQGHWAFEKPVKAVLPNGDDPAWSVSAIDRFVLDRLRREKLNHAPQADKRTLARRVSLDLTGLPPTPESLARFIDDKSPKAYEKYVDGLLASPAFGERWARVWLDLARYADTKGYEKDLKRNIWRYRDWLISALNSDLPYDQFTRDQLAGDLVPNHTPDQLLATAFHRNTLTNDEGGTDDEEFRIAAVKDRVDTTGQVWMGLTIGCAKCHSHKYDPISQREYYQFYGFFNQTADNDRYDDSPSEVLPDATQRKRLETLASDLKKREGELIAETPERLAAFAKWQNKFTGETTWKAAKPLKTEAASKSAMKQLDDGSTLVSGTGPASEQYRLTFAPVSAKALRLETIPDASLPKKGTGRSINDGNFVLSGIKLEGKTRDGKTVAIKFASAEADFAQDNYPVAHVLANPDIKKKGWAISPQLTELHQAVFRLEKPLTAADVTELTLTLDHQFEYSYPGFSIGRFRISFSEVENAPVGKPVPSAIRTILAIAPEKRTPEQRAQLYKQFAMEASETASIRAEISRIKGEISAMETSVRTPIARELPADKKRVTRIHNRGNFLDLGDTVEVAAPVAFGAFPAGMAKNRLGVAAWLVSAENPLTARVAVNRYWAQFFGRGLVETQEDFGSQGQPPSHPELLDWLAVDFRESGWSLKRLCKTIVMSETYRQSSRATAEQIKRDTHNVLLGRGPRFRLDAETLRDQALAVSGLLSAKMYGPSVMPFQPDGIWKSTYNADTWTTSAGEDRHRRGIYTFIKRTSPYPQMLTLDAPSRELCTVRRITTNTPLQALVTLNDPVFVEAAQALARRVVKDGGKSPEDRIALALRLALAREADPREVKALKALYERRLETLHKDNDAATKLATQPIGPLPQGWDASELASFTNVCNVILNLDEFLTRN